MGWRSAINGISVGVAGVRAWQQAMLALSRRWRSVQHVLPAGVPPKQTAVIVQGAGLSPAASWPPRGAQRDQGQGISGALPRIAEEVVNLSHHDLVGDLEILTVEPAMCLMRGDVLMADRQPVYRLDVLWLLICDDNVVSLINVGDFRPAVAVMKDGEVLAVTSPSAMAMRLSGGQECGCRWGRFRGGYRYRPGECDDWTFSGRWFFARRGSNRSENAGGQSSLHAPERSSSPQIIGRSHSE
jgi:hypothetical protein